MPTNQNDTVHLSAPIAKTVETPDGGREVWGFATLERKDKQDEIADYEGTVKAFQTWSAEVEKRTSGKSKGNLRVMHGPVAAGKMIHWEPQETTIQDEDGTQKTVKGIWTGAYIPPTKQDVIKDVDEGILSAFSIGGKYAKRWYDDAEKAFRYVPELSEYSLVDNPAVPGADIVQVINKADGPWKQDDRNMGGEHVEDDLEKAKGSQNDKLHEEAKKRADKYGISFKDGKGHLTPPKGKPTDPSEYGDPVNYAYPIDKSHIKAAVSYFNHDGERDKGGYSESEWSKIGHRIASAAKRLEGGDYSYKGGKIVTPSDKKGANKSMTLEEIQKAANDAGITVDQLMNVIKAIAPSVENVPTVDGDGDGDHNKEFPNPPGGDEKINIQAGEDDVKEAERESGVAAKEPGPGAPAQGAGASTAKSEGEGELQKVDDHVKKAFEEMEKATALAKSDGGELGKAGRRLSRETEDHIKKAVFHCMTALNDANYDPRQELRIENGEQGHSNTGEEAPPVAVKADISEALSKAVGDQMASVMEKFDAMAKGLVSLEKYNETVEQIKEVKKSLDQFDELKKSMEETQDLVKQIHETPQVGGPLVNGGSPDLRRLFVKSAGDNQSIAEVEESVLKGLMEKTTDSTVKDRIGQELALRQARAAFGK